MGLAVTPGRKPQERDEKNHVSKRQDTVGTHRNCMVDLEQ